MIQDKVEKSERILYFGKTACGECHHFDSPGGRAAPERIIKGQVPKLMIEPTNVPQVWFKHAVFNHASHRALDCRACHARAYPGSTDNAGRPNASVIHTDVLLPRMETCLECHSPPHRAGGLARGGARFDCTECHRYHHGESPESGIGAAARGVPRERRLDLERFLLGRP